MSKKKRPSAHVTRRQFVKTAAGAGLAAAAFSVSPWGSFRAWCDEREYDYIIVGSGAGGGTLAARLVQKGKRVLLLEAGSRETKGMRTAFPIFHPKEPVGHAFASEDPNLAWGFYVKHYKNHGENGKKSRYLDSMNSCYMENVYGDQKRTGIFYPRGSTIGGSTAVNAMITLYPDNEDWNYIARLTGDDTWSSCNMWDIYKRLDPNHPVYDGTVKPEWETEVMGWAKPWLQNQHIDQDIIKLLVSDESTQRVLFAAVVGAYFGDKMAQKDMEQLFGSIRTLNFQDLDLFSPKKFKQAMNAIFNSIRPNTWEYVSSKTEGFLDIPRATLKGRRFGTRDLIEKMEAQYGKRGSVQAGLFEVQDQTLVTSVEFAFPGGSSPVAVGVNTLRGANAKYGAQIEVKDAPTVANASEFIRLSKGGEVILSGGAFNTPQLLMLSGVGPWDELPADVPRVKNLPGVGKNLQDRYEVTVTTELENKLGVLAACNMTKDEQHDKCLRTWNADPSKSIYQSNGVLAAITQRSSVRQGSPDLMVFCLGGDFQGYKLHYSWNAAKTNYVSWAILKGHTENTAGEVKLRSSSPTDTPEVNFNYFDEGSGDWQKDLQAVTDGVNLVQDKLRAPLKLSSGPFGTHSQRFKGTQGWIEHLPAELVKKYKDEGSNLQSRDVKDRDLKDWIQKNAWGHHASCTCKMGPASDRMAVIDSKFRVHGIDNLRVVDASVFPKIPGLFIAVPTYLIGEKAAAAIIGDERASDPTRMKCGQ